MELMDYEDEYEALMEKQADLKTTDEK